MKLRMKEQFRKFVLLEMTSMRQPPKKVHTEEIQRKINILFSQQSVCLHCRSMLTPGIH